MSPSSYISIEELKVLKKQTLQFRLSYSKSIEKYFLSNIFYVKYDENIEDVDVSILMIPAIANVILPAWATGSDVYVKKLDRTYLESLRKVKSLLQKWYPKLSFSTQINVEEIISNHFNKKGYGLLFSGGVDSTCSYIRHKDKNPKLIMICGADIPLNGNVWTRIKKQYQNFAKKEGREITFIESNMNEFININLLTAKFGRFLTDLSWWGGIQHGIVLLGLCPPITVKNIRTLFIASTLTKEFKHPWGSHPLIDNKISWGDLKVVHDGYHLDRQEKIRNIKNDWLRSHKQYPLRVCWEKPAQFNCSKCEKCWRTMIGLIMEGIDPKILGFDVEDNFFESVKSSLVEKQVHFTDTDVYFWQTLQNHIKNNTAVYNLYNSRAFFEWFKTFEIRVNMKKKTLTRFLWIIYYGLPKCVQYLLSNLNKVGRFLH